MPFFCHRAGWVYAAVTNSIKCKVFATWGERRVRAAEKIWSPVSLLTRGKMKGNQVCWYIKSGKSLSLCAFLSQFIPLRWNIIKSGCAISRARAGARAAPVRRHYAHSYYDYWVATQQKAAARQRRLPLLCVFLIFRTPAAFIFNFTLKPLSGAINHSRRAKCRSNFKRLTQYLTQTLGNRTLAHDSRCLQDGCRMGKKRRIPTAIFEPESCLGKLFRNCCRFTIGIYGWGL